MAKIKRKKCKCNKLKKKDLKAACKDGCKSVKACFIYHNCYPKCGKCTPFVRQLLKKQKEKSVNLKLAS